MRAPAVRFSASVGNVVLMQVTVPAISRGVRRYAFGQLAENVWQDAAMTNVIGFHLRIQPKDQRYLFSVGHNTATG